MQEALKLPARLIAVKILTGVLIRKISLSSALEQWSISIPPGRESMVKELCFGILRWYIAFDHVLEEIIAKPLAAKHLDVKLLIFSGFYQLKIMRTPNYAAVHETVRLCECLNKPWAQALVNAVLRKSVALNLDFHAFGGGKTHPSWLVKLLVNVWGEKAQEIFRINQTKAPLILRVNTSRILLAKYLSQVKGENICGFPQAVRLANPVNSNEIHGFSAGMVSVQDAGAQLAAAFLGAKNGEKVLDACGAPGGKSIHILENAANVDLTIMDVNQKKLAKISANLARTGYQASVVEGDAGSQKWWDGKKFAKILLDVPCSGSGVIRRNPDIRINRAPEDITRLVTIQYRLLANLWHTLQDNGALLYVTCSILPEENNNLINRFIKDADDCKEMPLSHPEGIKLDHGLQLLPAENHDGFYYALLNKVRVKSPLSNRSPYIQ